MIQFKSLKFNILTCIIFIVSYSEAQSVYILNILQPDTLEIPIICNVGVNKQNKTFVVCNSNSNRNDFSYKIYRKSFTQPDQWDSIGQIKYSKSSIFVDSTAALLKHSSIYKVSAIDQCSNETGLSSELNSIFLSLTKKGKHSYMLNWNHYLGTNVVGYYIYRFSDSNNLQNIGSTSSDVLFFTDELAPEGKYYYQVEALRPDKCHDLYLTDVETSSRSNFVSNEISTSGFHIFSRLSLSIYPNPCINKTTLSFLNNENQLYNISIIDLTGKIVFSKKTTNDIVELELDNLLKGIYIIEVKGLELFTGKLIIE
jgi:hypothetical protein